MGFERLAMAIQGKKSNYDSDVFSPLIDFVASKANVVYGQNEQIDVAIRVIVDHVRAVAFTVADGQLPSNTGAGYVIRRILRRAVRYGFNYLDFKEPFIYTLLPVLAGQFDDVFPELAQQQDFVAKVIREEETSFLRTLENGLKIFNDAYHAAKAISAGDSPVISGEAAFKLYDTYGFPIDLTQLLARERNASVNMEEFTSQMQTQKERSRSDAAQEKGDWIILKDDAEVTFAGYDTCTTNSQILRYRQITEKKKIMYQLVLEHTPFYAESGGQVGDTGYIEANGEKVIIIDTQRENQLIIQYAEKLPSDLQANFLCLVDASKRQLTENNHSATHLLQAALRQVLGDHVQQRGSLVNDKFLRFDFSHFAKVTAEELEKIEEIVNAKIRENVALDEKRNVPLAEARSLGAMALFGEKYGEYVRVITFDPGYSVELCGGTHVKSTGQIGLFKIVSESSIAAGVRRIEAITAVAAEAYLKENVNMLNQVRELFNHPKDLLKAIESTLEEKNKLAKEIEKIQMAQAGDIKKDLVAKAQKTGNGTFIIEQVQLPNADTLKKIAFELKNEIDDLFMVLAADIEGKPQVAVMISDKMIAEHHLHAGTMIRDLAKEINGGGGGQPFYATAGGKELSGLRNVVDKAKKLMEDVLV